MDMVLAFMALKAECATTDSSASSPSGRPRNWQMCLTELRRSWGAGEASVDEGTPGPEGAPDPESGCLSPHPDLESGGGGGRGEQNSASLPQFPHLQVEGLGCGFWGFPRCGLWRVLWGEGKDGAGLEVTARGRDQSSISCRVNSPSDSKLVCAQPRPTPGPRRAPPFTQGRTPGRASPPLPPYPLPSLPPSVISP